MNAIYLLEQGAKPWLSPAWAFVCPGSGSTSLNRGTQCLIVACMLVSNLHGKEIPKEPLFLEVIHLKIWDSSVRDTSCFMAIYNLYMHYFCQLKALYKLHNQIMYFTSFPSLLICSC